MEKRVVWTPFGVGFFLGDLTSHSQRGGILDCSGRSERSKTKSGEFGSSVIRVICHKSPGAACEDDRGVLDGGRGKKIGPVEDRQTKKATRSKLESGRPSFHRTMTSAARNKSEEFVCCR